MNSQCSGLIEMGGVVVKWTEFCYAYYVLHSCIKFTFCIGRYHIQYSDNGEKKILSITLFFRVADPVHFQPDPAPDPDPANQKFKTGSRIRNPAIFNFLYVESSLLTYHIPTRYYEHIPQCHKRKVITKYYNKSWSKCKKLIIILSQVNLNCVRKFVIVCNIGRYTCSKKLPLLFFGPAKNIRGKKRTLSWFDHFSESSVHVNKS